MNTNFLINENIPVVLTLQARIKEWVHDIFRNPKIVKLFTYLPACLFAKHKELAKLIIKCRDTFENKHEELKNLNSMVYGGDKVSSIIEYSKLPGSTWFQKDVTVIFSSNDSLSEARKLAKNDPNGKIGILNLANRRQPGGVGLAPYGGSQEEFLIRRSNLAWALDPRFKLETINKTLSVHEQQRVRRKMEGFKDEPFMHHIPYFGAVVTKNVTFIDNPQKDEFTIISSAAPDLRKGSDEEIAINKFGTDSEKALDQVLHNKIKAIFEAAIHEQIDTLVLGAYGCGCFQNDPARVASIFKRFFKDPNYNQSFKTVSFAITDEAKLKVFEKVIKGN